MIKAYSYILRNLSVVVFSLFRRGRFNPTDKDQVTEICGQLIDYCSFKCAIQFIYYDHIVK